MIKDGEKRGREHRKKDQKHLIRDKKTEREREREREINWISEKQRKRCLRMAMEIKNEQKAEDQ